MSDPLTEDERAAIAAYLARHGVTRVAPGFKALDLDEIAPGVRPGDLSNGHRARWWHERDRARHWAMARVAHRIAPLEAMLGIGEGAPGAIPAAKPKGPR